MAKNSILGIPQISFREMKELFLPGHLLKTARVALLGVVAAIILKLIGIDFARFKEFIESIPFLNGLNNLQIVGVPIILSFVFVFLLKLFIDLVDSDGL